MNEQQRNAMTMALEALEKVKNHGNDWWDLSDPITALREALAQPQGEHKTDGTPCWCNPDVTYENPETGAKVIVHKEPVTLPLGEQFCYCGNEISLQMVSGGAAPEGLYGRVTLKVGDKYVDYYTAPPEAIKAAIEATKEKAAQKCDDLYKHDRRASGYDEGWNDALGTAEHAIRSMK